MMRTADSRKPKFTIRDMAMIAVLAALGFAANYIQFPIPTPLGATRLHLGNVMCLLSGLLLGPVHGGLAAGFGAMFYDFTNPLFINEAWITFLTKFAMAWVCGMVAFWRGAGANRFKRNAAATVCGALSYTILYLVKNLIQGLLLRMESETILVSLLEKGGVSLFNGVLAVVITLPLFAAVKGALTRGGRAADHRG